MPVELDEETKKSIDKFHKLMILDFFEGPETVKSEIFLRLIRDEHPMPSEEVKARLDHWTRKREEILEDANS